GVHRSAQRTFDISADMQELGRTSVAVVASGCKSILDIPLTLEYLETMGVTVVGYKTDEFPSFFARTSGHKVDYRADNGTEVARMLAAKRALNIPGGLLVCNPILEKDALDFHEMDRMINEACEEAERDGVGGKELTPYLLEAVVEKSGGRSQLANQALIENNVSAAGDIAVAMAEQGL
ncbi:MAG: pseudouridine-5'-phosphate glycosidase, partial [Oscillospiraceae bacterium]|nr:pseudouridine-5'-phosphate glycosidase [Oscillospiraceae bacterium]